MGNKDRTTQRSIKEFGQEDLRAMEDRIMNAIEGASRQTGEKIDGLEEQISSLRADFGTKIKEVSERFEADLEETKEELKKENRELRAELIRVEYHDRKYNLVFSGLQSVTKGKEEAAILDLCQNKLDIQSPPTLINVHPLSEGRIIARFLKWSDRQEVLGKAKALKGSKIFITTDLPQPLREKRARLLKECKDIRTNEGIQARIIERGQDILLQTRASAAEQWITKK